MKAKEVDAQFLSNTANREEMEKTEKVFKLIHNFCKENLEVGYTMLNQHIEELLDPKKEVSPLLKYYNDLVKFSNFRLPSTTLLNFDQMYFRKYLDRVRQA
jgi:hypothetical protein